MYFFVINITFKIKSRYYLFLISNNTSKINNKTCAQLFQFSLLLHISTNYYNINTCEQLLQFQVNNFLTNYDIINICAQLLHFLTNYYNIKTCAQLFQLEMLLHFSTNYNIINTREQLFQFRVNDFDKSKYTYNYFNFE